MFVNCIHLNKVIKICINLVSKYFSIILVVYDISFPSYTLWRHMIT